MRKIWLVSGFCGEYSDRQEWNVCAYDTEEAANVHAKKAIDNMPTRQSPGSPDGDHPFDPNYRTDYTGTDYAVEELLLWEESDTAPRCTVCKDKGKVWDTVSPFDESRWVPCECKKEV